MWRRYCYKFIFPLVTIDMLPCAKCVVIWWTGAHFTNIISIYFRLIPSHYFPLVLLMMTSSNGNIFRVTGHLCGEFTGPVARSFDGFFDLRLNKRLGKQSRGWWFETLSCPLWRHCNAGAHFCDGQVSSKVDTTANRIYCSYHDCCELQHKERCYRDVTWASGRLNSPSTYLLKGMFNLTTKILQDPRITDR